MIIASVDLLQLESHLQNVKVTVDEDDQTKHFERQVEVGKPNCVHDVELTANAHRQINHSKYSVKAAVDYGDSPVAVELAPDRRR